MRSHKFVIRSTAKVLLLTFGFQLVLPVYSHALTTGPSQPEVQSFEPVGTTDMVNTFTGDFTYNIPLLDVEGYPINIAYHSGVTMEQESTWCGLGWNINPGEINRSVRGLPDDFNGEKLEREINIKSEKNVRVGTGANVGLELLGKDSKELGLGLSFSLGMYVNYNNYRGLSAGTNTGVSVSTPVASAGIDMGIGSQSGADFDVNGSVNISGKIAHDMNGGITVGVGSGFNSRQGLKDLSFNVSASVKSTAEVEQKQKVKQEGSNDTKTVTKMKKDARNPTKEVPALNKKQGGSTSLFGSSVRIGLQNYVPVVTNKSTMNSFSFQIKGGGEISMFYPNFYVNAQVSNTDYDINGTREGYGYLYSENADDRDIMDFTRDKDGIYNRTLSNLPPSTSTYDVYSVSGQGTGGSFRPFRNDIGSFYDPLTESSADSKDIMAEFGIGNLFEVGADVTFYDNTNRSGPWMRIPFGGAQVGKLFEKVFFKAGGELTYNQHNDNTMLASAEPVYVNGGKGLVSRSYTIGGTLPEFFGRQDDRTSRANHIAFLTTAEASVKDAGSNQNLVYYADNPAGNARFFDPLEQTKNRWASDDYQLRKHQIGEFTQTLQDGRRYVYGLPALNHMSREISFSIDETRANSGTGLVKIVRGAGHDDDTRSNEQGRDHYYNSTATPAHAHSYLLTSVLSTDYVDVLGDGPTDDDLGSFTKFNYKLWNDDYRWRAPYHNDSALYNAGYHSDSKDGKGSYTVGSRQVWQLRSVESKNYIAEFYVSPREDGRGSNSAVLPDNSQMRMPYGINLKATAAEGTSFKLDSIRLFSKHDRYVNENNAIPVKTIIFKYDYSLCKNIPNTSMPGSGKLTLKNIYIRYGNSDKNLLSPYNFSYNTPNPDYTFLAKDRWGNYKPALTGNLTNYEFPYAAQSGTGVDSVAAWHLSDIKLPSGGQIHVDYETKDYAFVQDRRAMQMFVIEGFGSSPNLERKSSLYENANNISDYVYFKRDKARESRSLSLWSNYLEGQTKLYYCFNVDITGNGKYEYIKSYAKIDAVERCPNDTNYGYVRLSRENAGNMRLHPATVYGLNTARYYLPHVLYPGSGDGSNIKNIVEGLLGAAEELRSIWQNPFRLYVDKGRARKVRLDRSWIRLQAPGLCKKGGGVRVKRLSLTDRWSDMSGASGVDAVYGKEYDYTVRDPRYGVISSGVATYEPLIGGDENPFRMPASSYQAEGGKLLPSIDFYQEEPFGESLFPGPFVGYSSVVVKSIHADKAASAQSKEEFLYYTAKDFPIEVTYTPKEAPGQQVVKTLRKVTRREEVLQGYTFRFNDMHGKPKAVNNYGIKTVANYTEPELITGTKYFYNIDSRGKLSNAVRAMVRERGTRTNYQVRDGVLLGQETDFSVDSRQSYFRSYNRKIQTNVNSTIYGLFPVVIPTVFWPDKEEEQDFKTMVSTKIIQQYGIVKAVEQFDHGAVSTMENMIFDAESGEVILTRMDNEFRDNTYTLSYPAHLAYKGMGPAYTNAGYEEIASYMETATASGGPLDPASTVLIHVADPAVFSKGDEILLSYQAGKAERTQKVWCVGFSGANAISVAPRYKAVDNNLYWPDWTTNRVDNVHLKILRSGHRNMLTSSVQQVTLTENPFQNSINDILGASPAFSKALSVSGALYLPRASAYTVEGPDSEDTAANTEAFITPGGKLRFFNPYVLGLKGNYLKRETYSGLEDRNYTSGHARYDGVYPIKVKLWTNRNNGSFDPAQDDGIIATNGGTFTLTANNTYLTSQYQRGTFVTNSDPFGHVIEELNLQSRYSAAQYGYNTQLPVAVAMNASQREFFADGFEDYSILQPEGLRRLRFHSSFLFTPFAKLFRSPKPLGSYSNANNSGAYFEAAVNMRRSGQNYSIRSSDAVINNLVNSNLQISSEASHTGSYSLKSSAAIAIPIPTNYAAQPADLFSSQGSDFDWKIQSFGIPVYNKKCVISLWARSVNTSSQPQVSFSINGTTTALQARTTSIDGWYLLEALVGPGAGSGYATLNLSAGIYIDDVRMQPIDASVRSFVYNPFNFRLMAQLDENNVATFFEYDQEGRLVRTKRETSQGIKTISENRSASAKR